MKPRTGALASIVAGALIVAGLVSGAPAHAASAASATVGDAQSTSSESDALAIARQYDHSVVVDSDTTPTTQVAARPDGTMQLTEDALPVRVQQGTSWVPVDTTLQQLSNDLWAPSATVAPVRFGPGGSNVLDKVETSDGDWITETWPYGNLPSPTVEGSTATYGDVLPGVDIVLTATSTGLSDVLEIESATAAANPDLKSLMLPVSGATVAATASQTATAAASDGSSVVSASPVWWDASDGSDAEGPVGNAPAMPMKSAVSTSGLSMAVQSTVQAADPVYPVFVDPDWSSGGSPFWFTDAAYPNQSYLNGNYADGIQSVGIGGGYRSDMFWQFSMGAMAGKVIQNAVLNTTQTWAGSCSLSPIDVHLYGPQGAGFTWNQEQSWSGQWGGILQSQNPTAGCPGQGAGAVGWSVTSGVASKAAAGASIVQFAFTYDNPSAYSRRHYSQSASLVVTYDSRPNDPTNAVFGSPSRTCGTASAPAVINGTLPITFSVTQSDPDGGNVGDDFYYAPASSLTTTTKTTIGPMAQGTISDAVAANTFAQGTEYAWRAQGTDFTTVSSGLTAWCYFTIDNTAPATPVLPAGPLAGLTVGAATTFASTPGGPAGDATEYETWVSNGTDASSAPVVVGSQALPACGSSSGAATFVCPDASGAVTVTAVPLDTVSTAWVAAVDAAGNMSPPVGVTLHAADASETGAHGWHPQALPSGQPLPTTIPDDNTTSGTGLSGEKDLTIGSGLSLTGTGTVPVDSSAESVFSLPGLIALDREYNGNDHVSDTEGTVSPGYHVEEVIGQMLPLTTNGTSPLGATTLIYSCAFANGSNMTSSNATCEGTGATPTKIGYSFNSKPAGIPSVQVWRCTNGSYRITTTSPTCEVWNRAPDGSLGWFVKTGTISTAAQAVDTTQSFTASAWVQPGATSAGTNWHTAISEAGPSNSGFYLQEAPGGVVQFCVRSQTTTTSACAASSSGTAQPGVWLFLTGIYDSASHQVRLLIGKTIRPVAVAPYLSAAGDVSANGGVTIGSAITAGKSVDQWDGSVADPVVIPAVVDSTQLEDLYFETPVG